MCSFWCAHPFFSVRILGKEEQALAITSDDVANIRKLGKRKDIFGEWGYLAAACVFDCVTPWDRTAVR